MSARAAATASSAIALLAATLAQPVMAQPEPGDWFITESLQGAVENVRDGGDFGSVPGFATGLDTPMGLCRGPGDDLYVTAQEAAPPGAVYVITAGGDFGSATPFADVPGYPTSLYCTDTQILVATMTEGTYLGEIYDITSGTAEAFADGFTTQVWTIFGDSQDTLWAATETGEVFDFTAGGDVGVAPYAHFPAGVRLTGLGEIEGSRYVGVHDSGSVYPFDAGGDLTGTQPFATGMGVVRGLFADDDVGFYAVNQSQTWDISAGGTVSAVHAHGLNTFNSQWVYWHGCGDGVVWHAGGEQCDDGNTDSGDGCSDCQDEGAGGGGVGGGGAGGGVAGAPSQAPWGENDEGCSCGLLGHTDRKPLGALAFFALLAGAAARRRRPIR